MYNMLLGNICLLFSNVFLSACTNTCCGVTVTVTATVINCDSDCDCD